MPEAPLGMGVQMGPAVGAGWAALVVGVQVVVAAPAVVTVVPAVQVAPAATRGVGLPGACSAAKQNGRHSRRNQTHMRRWRTLRLARHRRTHHPRGADSSGGR